MNHDRFKDTETKILRSIVFSTSMISIVFLSLRNWYRKKWIKIYLDYSLKQSKIKNERNMYEHYNDAIIGSESTLSNLRRQFP